ncbi:MAG TPA: phosphate-starvation-inducible PsiE family protein [Ktedonobacteraceae bacterium]|nr:phosphate-starvation-inducible PsiE family protein [Ktedonobacteraceae bacterium]
MSQPDQHVNTSKQQGTLITDETDNTGEGHLAEEDRLSVFTERLLDRGDTIIYAIVGVSFLLAGILTLGYSFWNFAYLLQASPMTPNTVVGAIVSLISDLLLVVIIMEVLGTVIHYLKSHVTSLRPFLYIGIISATRGILLIGAKLTVGGNPEIGMSFTNDMIELGVSAGIILALGITIKLLGKSADFEA